MGLLFGLGLLAAAAVPDVYRSCKAKAEYQNDIKKYGYDSRKARDVIVDIMTGLNCCQQKYGFTVHTDGKKICELTKKYEEKGEVRARFHAIHDVAEEYCKEHNIPFTGKYVNTFYLPGYRIY